MELWRFVSKTKFVDPADLTAHGHIYQERTPESVGSTFVIKTCILSVQHGVLTTLQKNIKKCGNQKYV